MQLNRKNLIVIKIKENDEKPVFFRGDAYKRVGKSNHKLTASEIRKLVKESSKSYWDEQICEGAGLKDVDWNFINNFFIPKYELITGIKLIGGVQRLLEALGGIKENKPTNAGILLFGKEPQNFFMNSYIALARYREDVEGAERLDYKEFSGNLFQQIDNCDKYIKEHIAMMSKIHIDRVEREDIPEYPIFSIRELITNAVCHRNYVEQRSKVIIKMFNNRIDYYNPGGLQKGINPRNITEKQYSRNPTIAKVLSKIKYIEEVGEGWDKIIDEHKKHPLKPQIPKIDSDEYSIIISLFSTKKKFEKAKEIDVKSSVKSSVKILNLIKVNSKISIPEIAERLKLSTRAIEKNIVKLRETGILKRVGPAKGGYWEIIKEENEK